MAEDTELRALVSWMAFGEPDHPISECGRKLADDHKWLQQKRAAEEKNLADERDRFQRGWIAFMTLGSAFVGALGAAIFGKSHQ